MMMISELLTRAVTSDYRTQFKSVLGLGLSYTMKNYKEDKK